MPTNHVPSPAPKKNETTESVPTAADRARFYQGATQERMDTPRRSMAEIDKSTDASRFFDGRTLLDTAAENRHDVDKFNVQKIAEYATKAAEYGDIATGRKKASPEGEHLPKYKDGGIVRKTGPAIVHEGELVIPKSARRGLSEALSGEGARLKPAAIHIERTQNKGYMARHQMRDEYGRLPTDGQSHERVYGLVNHDELQKHIAQHFGDEVDDDDLEESEQPR